MSSTTERNGAMHDPPHPGEVLRGLYLEPQGLTLTETARALGVSRTSLSLLVNGRVRLSVDMALRLAEAFGTSPELWLNLQHQRDLWQARRDPARPRVRPLTGRKAAPAARRSQPA